MCKKIYENVTFGNNVVIGHNVIIYPKTIIGDNVVINDNSIIGKQPTLISSPWTKVENVEKETIIKDNVVIGSIVIIYAGCVIESNAFVADMANIREKCVIGNKTIVGRCATLEHEVKIGNESVISTGSHVAGKSIIGNKVLLAPNACLINSDKSTFNSSCWDITEPVAYPSTIEEGVIIGTNATIYGNIIIHSKSIIGAGSVVTKSVPSGETWVGNPARKIIGVK